MVAGLSGVCLQLSILRLYETLMHPESTISSQREAKHTNYMFVSVQYTRTTFTLFFISCEAGGLVIARSFGRHFQNQNGEVRLKVSVQ